MRRKIVYSINVEIETDMEVVDPNSISELIKEEIDGNRYNINKVIVSENDEWDLTITIDSEEGSALFRKRVVDDSGKSIIIEYIEPLPDNTISFLKSFNGTMQ